MTDTGAPKGALDQVSTWYPEETAFVQALVDRRVTFAEANAKMRRIANRLVDLGVEHGDRIAMLADPSIEHPCTFFACPKLGAVSSTLHVRGSTGILQEMVRDLGARAVVFDHEYAEIAEAMAEDDNDVEALVEYGRGEGESSFAT